MVVRVCVGYAEGTVDSVYYCWITVFCVVLGVFVVCVGVYVYGCAWSLRG
jgi:hypothetical protein